MNIIEALNFLRSNQPMPDDQDLEEPLIQKYNEVREFFLAHPDERCVPLFLNSFGEGDGFGVYQLVEDVIRKFAPLVVVPYLADGLRSHRKSVRYWNAEIAAIFPSRELVEPLKALLRETEVDLRAAAVIALCQINQGSAIQVLKDQLLVESDQHILKLIKEQIPSE